MLKVRHRADFFYSKRLVKIISVNSLKTMSHFSEDLFFRRRQRSEQ